MTDAIRYALAVLGFLALTLGGIESSDHAEPVGDRTERTHGCR